MQLIVFLTIASFIIGIIVWAASFLPAWIWIAPIAIVAIFSLIAFSRFIFRLLDNVTEYIQIHYENRRRIKTFLAENGRMPNLLDEARGTFVRMKYTGIPLNSEKTDNRRA